MFSDFNYRRWLSVVGVATLALGIGVNAALFTAFLRPQPLKDADTIVRLDYQNGSGTAFSFADYQYVQEHTQVFSDLVAEQDEKFFLGEKARGAEHEEILGTFISENFLSIVGDSTRLGRVFTAEENSVPGFEPVVVLSHRFWQRRFAGDPQVIGRTILLDGKPFTVIGVTNSSFVGLRDDIPDLWLPLTMRAAMPTVYFEDTPPEERDWFGQTEFQWVTVHGRLRPGKSIAEARTEIATLLPQLPHPQQERRPDQTVLVAQY
jgi:putative ABC transport system permease protein